MADILDDLLARSARTIDVAQTQHAADDLASEVMQARILPVRRVPRRVTIGVAALLVAAPATAAAAVAVGAHTGIFGNPFSNSEDVDRSEWLNTCSPDYRDFIRDLQPSASEPLPARVDWDMATTTIQRDSAAACADGASGIMQETGLRRSYNYWAQCAWLREAADPTTARSALPAVADALRHYGASEVNKATDGGGIVEHDLAVADQVAAGDLTEATRQAKENCEILGTVK